MTNPADTMRRKPDVDLDGRLAFLEVDERTAGRLRDIKPLLEQHLPIALDKFYEKVKLAPTIRQLFRDDAHMAYAKSAQLDHWKNISSGKLDSGYVANVRRIGQTHARIGLEPRWYIGGYALLLEHLVAVIVEETRPKSFLAFNQKHSNEDLVARLVALMKAVMLDMDFSISTYIEAAENARLDAEAERQRAQSEADARQHAADLERERLEEAASAERAKVLDAITKGLSALANKDLAHRIGDGIPARFERVRTDYNLASSQLDQALQVVMQRTGKISAATEEILSASENLSQRAQTSAASLEESAAALEQTAVSVQNSAKSTSSMQELISSTSTKAAHGGGIVKEAVDAVTKIEDSSKQIHQIVGVIDEIAFQTNLLALNAGVEAARAGEHGRGFAVVASEVRALAQRSADSAREIKALISVAQENVGDGVRLVTDTGRVFDDISQAIAKIKTVMADIALAAQEQAHALSGISGTVASMDQDTQKNAAMAEQLTASTNTLAAETDELKNLVTVFQTTSAGSASASAAKLRVVS